MISAQTGVEFRSAQRPDILGRWSTKKTAKVAALIERVLSFTRLVFLIDFLHGEEMQIFVDGMRSHIVETGLHYPTLTTFPASVPWRTLGGSQGLVLSMVLTKYSLLRGILFDLPIVIQGAPRVS
jgi:hypothetical protein